MIPGAYIRQMPTPSGSSVVTVTSNDIEGTVVRWHHDLASAVNHHPALSASQHGVHYQGPLNEVPQDWIDAAIVAWETLRADPGADMTRLATHAQRVVLGSPSGPLEPVENN